MDKLKMHSRDNVKEHIAQIAALFPNALTETIKDGKVVQAIDFDVLKQELSEVLVDGPAERYQFTWPDKRKSILLANAPIAKTLRPYRDESVDFDTAENLYIEGDNLDALKLLQETYLHSIKMIYIDPPYNTGNNLLYKNDFKMTSDEYLANSGQFDNSMRLVSNPESDGRFHTNWVNMIYPRLRLAKDLLSEDGILVCAIDENEVATLSLILRELFGESSFEIVCVSIVHNPRGVQGINFSYTHEYAIFVYPIGKKIIADRKIKSEDVSWSQLRNWGGESSRSDAKNCFYPIIVCEDKIIGFGDVSPDNYHPRQTEKIGNSSYVYPIDRNGVERKWRYARQTVESIADMLRVRKSDDGYEIEIGKTFGTQRTVWTDKRYDANEYGTKIINELVPNSGFTFPKSLWTVYDAIYAGASADNKAIILDFFAGSSTTAHAVMQLNAEDEGRRKFIMVQLPEAIDEESDAYTAGYKNICEIGKERIRRAGKKIKSEAGESAENLDIGFRVLKVDSTNMRDVYYTPSEYQKDFLSSLADNIKSNRTAEDLLFQVMLDLGILLSSKINETKVGGKKVFDVAEGYLLACFDDDVNSDVVTEIAKRKPYYAIFRDSGIASDSVATNFEQIFATYSPTTVRKVL